MSEEKLQYRSIFKATSLFGGVQLYQILIQVIKSKIIAMLLGTSGVGIQGLFVSATEMVKNISSMGLSQSAVKDVSEANATGNNKRIQIVVAVLRRLVLITGILGLVLVIALSPVLSNFSFGDYSYILSFVFLSVILLFDQVCSGQKVVLQGMRKLQFLAKASSIGVTVGLFISVPLLFWLREKGIVPMLIISSFSSMLITWYYSNKVGIKNVSVSKRQIVSEGSSMLKMGIAMSMSGILTSACAYIIRSYIRYRAGTDVVGLYAAGFSIINTYVGMVFTAIGTDYYPRLASVHNNREKASEVINKQGEIGLLILSPLLSICCVFMPLVIRILYSSSFLPANDYIIWASVGMMFRLIAVLLAYQFIVSGDSKTYIINETIGSFYMLLLNILGFSIAGIEGLGFSFLVASVFYLVQIFLVTKKVYHFMFNSTLFRIFIINILFLISIVISIKLLSSPLNYLISGTLMLLDIVLAIWMLNKRIDLLGMIHTQIKRKQ